MLETLRRRRLLHKNEEPWPIPKEYQLVEYLQSTSALQWIDTEYAIVDPHFSLATAWCYAYTNHNVSTWGVDYTSAPRYMHGHFYLNNIYHGSSKQDCGVVLRTLDVDGIVKYITRVDFGELYNDSTKYKKQQLHWNIRGVDANGDDVEYIDKTVELSSQNNSIFEGVPDETVTDYMFSVRSKSGSPSYAGRFRIFYFIYYDGNGREVRKFYPVRRLSDGKTGMFEVNKQKFHENKKAIEFDVGPDIYKLPI